MKIDNQSVIELFPSSFTLKKNPQALIETTLKNPTREVFDAAYLGSLNLTEVARREGTPLIVYSKKHLEEQVRSYQANFRSNQFKTEILYATKAFSCKGILEFFAKKGLSLDVSSAGELFTAIKANFPPQRILFHGNNKSLEELRMAQRYGANRFVLDSLTEVKNLEKVYRLKGKANVFIRVIPGIKALTHKFLSTGTADSKFGLLMDDDNALAAVKLIKASKNLNLLGFHFHLGSQIFELKAYEKAFGNMLGWIKQIHQETGIEKYDLNLGGGLGIRYTLADKPPSIKEFCSYLVKLSESLSRKHRLKINKLLIEPGRSLVGSAGFTLYRVGTVKKSGAKLYVSVDGGMSDNLRPALYGSKYEIVNLTKPNASNETSCGVVGKHCETGDILIENAMLAQPGEGDLVAVPATGAYCYAMANNYNRLRRPAVILAGRDNYQILIRRETLKDLVSRDQPLSI